MNPSFLRRTTSCSASFIEVSTLSSIAMMPEVGVSRAARRYRSVLLPEPDGPTMNVKAPVGTSKDTPAGRGSVPRRFDSFFAGQTRESCGDSSGAGRVRLWCDVDSRCFVANGIHRRHP